jgi:hypothetical protein
MRRTLRGRASRRKTLRGGTFGSLTEACTAILATTGNPRALKKAYVQISRQYHPDKNPHPLAGQMFSYLSDCVEAAETRQAPPPLPDELTPVALAAAERAGRADQAKAAKAAQEAEAARAAAATRAAAEVAAASAARVAARRAEEERERGAAARAEAMKAVAAAKAAAKAAIPVRAPAPVPVPVPVPVRAPAPAPAPTLAPAPAPAPAPALATRPVTVSGTLRYRNFGHGPMRGVLNVQTGVFTTDYGARYPIKPVPYHKEFYPPYGPRESPMDMFLTVDGQREQAVDHQEVGGRRKPTTRRRRSS